MVGRAGHFTVVDMYHHPGDLLGLVADTFQVGGGLGHGDQQAQIAGHRGPQGQQAGTFLVGLDIQAIDHMVPGDNLPGAGHVLLVQGLDGPGDLLLHHAAHFQNHGTELGQVLVEAFQGMLFSR